MEDQAQGRRPVPAGLAASCRWFAAPHGGGRFQPSLFPEPGDSARPSSASLGECCRTGCPVRVDRGTTVAAARMTAAVPDCAEPPRSAVRAHLARSARLSRSAPPAQPPLALRTAREVEARFDKPGAPARSPAWPAKSVRPGRRNHRAPRLAGLATLPPKCPQLLLQSVCAETCIRRFHPYIQEPARLSGRSCHWA